MANANIEDDGISRADMTLIFNTRLWAGAAERDSTAWLQSPIGSNAAIGTLNMAQIDVEVTAHNTATTFDADDATGTDATPSEIRGLGITDIVSLVSVENRTNPQHVPTGAYSSGKTVVFTTANNAAVANDIHRITILYR